MSEQWVYLNGKICLERDAFIPISDRGFLFGEGLFTTIRLCEGKCEFVGEHLQRLRTQARILGIDHNPIDLAWLEQLIACNHAEEGIWRLKIILTVKHEQETPSVGTLLATLEPYRWIPWEPCSLCLYPSPIESPTAHVKTLAYLDHLQVKNYARTQGYHDAVTTNAQRCLLETGCSNIFWIDQGVLWMPDLALPYLKGVFIQSLLRHLPIPFHEIKAKLDQIPATASVYLCNCLTHIRPVVSIGSRLFQRNAERETLLQRATEMALEYYLCCKNDS